MKKTIIICMSICICIISLSTAYIMTPNEWIMDFRADDNIVHSLEVIANQTKEPTINCELQTTMIYKHCWAANGRQTCMALKDGQEMIEIWEKISQREVYIDNIEYS